MQRLSTVADVSARIDAAGVPVITLGETEFGDPVIAARRGPGTGPELMITSGAHAGEPSGVYGAVETLVNWDSALDLTVVPLRDPFAFEGMERCLERVTGVRPTLANHDQLHRFLTDHAVDVVAQEADFVLVDLGQALAASMLPADPPAGPRLIEARLNQLLAAEPHLVAKLTGRRVFYPSNAGPTSEDVGDFERAFSAEISAEGLVRDMNRRFGQPDAPTEVRLVAEFAESVNPYAILDLHEGQGESFYLFVSEYGADERTTRYADAIMDRLEAAGTRPTTLDDVVARLGERVRDSFTEGRPGVLVERKGRRNPEGQFSSFSAKFGPSITVESGRWAPLAQRIAIHRAAVAATVESILGERRG